MRILALTIVGLLLAGCSEPEAPPPVVAPAAAPPPGTWEANTAEGEFTTTTMFYAGGFLFGTEPVEVAEGAARAFFNGTVAGTLPDESTVRLVAEDCDGHDGCSTQGRTSGGAFSFSVEDPAPGDWSLSFWAATAAQRGTYDVEANAYVQPAAEA